MHLTCLVDTVVVCNYSVLPGWINTSCFIKTVTEQTLNRIKCPSISSLTVDISRTRTNTY